MKYAKRYPWIDVLYTIGIILVILGHSHPSDWAVFSGTIFEKIIIYIYTFHMPLFFFIAGFLFMNSNAIEKYGYVEWIKKKCIRLLVPYTVLSFIALVPKYYWEHNSFITFKELIKIIFIPRVGVWGHFWFIPVLLLCYAIFGFCRKIAVNENPKKMLYLTTLVSIAAYFFPVSTQWFGISDLKTVCIYFCIGMIVNYFEIYKKRIRKLFKGVCGIVLLFVSVLLFRYWYDNILVMFIESVLMIIVCCCFAKLIEYNRMATWISEHNFTIYIYSWLFQAIIMAICEKIGILWKLTCVFMFVIGFIGPISMIWIYDKIKRIHNRFFELVIGMK